jgi:hypothetical protein
VDDAIACFDIAQDGVRLMADVVGQHAAYLLDKIAIQRYDTLRVYNLRGVASPGGATWYSKTSVRKTIGGSPMLPGLRTNAANAPFVGANTVNCPGSLSV